MIKDGDKMNAKDILAVNKNGWEKSADRFFGRDALPGYGPFSPTEDELCLLDDVTDKKVLDVGCGSGHSLQYVGANGAAELWGIDLCAKQIAAASDVLADQPVPVTLFESPMEENPGLPSEYFDVVYSIYALGWTVDLNRTLSHIHGYLKPGGSFIFSWEHPFHDRLTYDDGAFVLNKSYNEEGPEFNEGWPQEVVIHHRKLSTYINSLIEAGFILEKIIDDVALPGIPSDNPSKWYSTQKAELVPATFIIKATKKH